MEYRRQNDPIKLIIERNKIEFPIYIYCHAVIITECIVYQEFFANNNFNIIKNVDNIVSKIVLGNCDHSVNCNSEMIHGKVSRKIILQYYHTTIV